LSCARSGTAANASVATAVRNDFGFIFSGVVCKWRRVFAPPGFTG
jgi:hypothetical protein